MKLIVTGGCGFIGSNFIIHMLHNYGLLKSEGDLQNYEKNPDISDISILNIDNLTYASNPEYLGKISNFPEYSFIKADIADFSQMNHIFDNFRPDIVVNFAAESHVDRSIESGEIFVKSNVMGVQVLLELSRRYEVKRFVQIGTDEVYGSLKEGSFSENSPLRPASPYSASKASADLLVLSHYRTYGLPVIITRCTNNFGPNQHLEKLVPKVISNSINNRDIPIYGDGTNVRDWIYVKDHCEAIRLVIENGELGQIYNVGGGCELSNLTIIERILEEVDASKKLMYFVEDRLGHDWRYSVDDSKIRALGWEPLISFTSGLEYAIDFVRGIQ